MSDLPAIFKLLIVILTGGLYFYKISESVNSVLVKKTYQFAAGPIILAALVITNDPAPRITAIMLAVFFSLALGSLLDSINEKHPFYIEDGFLVATVIGTFLLLSNQPIFWIVSITMLSYGIWQLTFPKRKRKLTAE